MVDQLREEDNSKPEPVPEQQLADVITSHNPGNYWVCNKARLDIKHWGGRHLAAGIWAPPNGEEDRQFMVHLQRLKWHHGDRPRAVWWAGVRWSSSCIRLLVQLPLSDTAVKVPQKRDKMSKTFPQRSAPPGSHDAVNPPPTSFEWMKCSLIRFEETWRSLCLCK